MLCVHYGDGYRLHAAALDVPLSGVLCVGYMLEYYVCFFTGCFYLCSMDLDMCV